MLAEGFYMSPTCSCSNFDCGILSIKVFRNVADGCFSVRDLPSNGGWYMKIIQWSSEVYPRSAPLNGYAHIFSLRLFLWHLFCHFQFTAIWTSQRRATLFIVLCFGTNQVLTHSLFLIPKCPFLILKCLFLTTTMHQWSWLALVKAILFITGFHKYLTHCGLVMLYWHRFCSILAQILSW